MIELPQFGAMAAETAIAATPAQSMTFAFGDPEPVLDGRQMLDMLECWHNSRWYEPPLSLAGLARAYRASPHHGSAINLKVNLLVSAFEPSALISRRALISLAQDYIVLGNAYPQRILNRLGRTLRIDAPLARYVRRGVDAGRFFWVPGGAEETEFQPNTIGQLMRPDLNQEIYGLPEYIGALQSALLNENATLFRRKYYLNGSHAGYILYATGEINEPDVDKLKDALRQSKGPGNFRNMIVHAPNGKDGSIKILPIAEAGAKDEFINIKNVTRDDVLAAHRVPPQLLGIVPANAGGFGKVTDAVDAFFELEMDPIIGAFLEINDLAGLEVLRRKPRASAAPAPIATAA